MSESMRPTLCPSLWRERARLAATVDLPTPPLPDATATLKRTSRRRAASAGGTPAAPRGGAIEGACTERRIVTAFTPGRDRSFSFASRSISSAARGDSVVISSRKETLPPPTARSLTKPNETMSRDSPGNLTVFRTSRTRSSVSSVVEGIGPPPAKLSRAPRVERGGRLLAQARHGLARALGQRGSVLRPEVRHRNRLAGAEHDPSRSRNERRPCEHAARSRETHGQNRRSRAHRQECGAFLERPELARPRPRLFRKDHERPAALETLERSVERRRAARPISPIDGNESGRADRPAQHGHTEHAPLREKPHRKGNVREKDDDVGEALVVGDQDHAPGAREPFGVKH